MFFQRKRDDGLAAIGCLAWYNCGKSAPGSALLAFSWDTYLYLIRIKHEPEKSSKNPLSVSEEGSWSVSSPIVCLTWVDQRVISIHAPACSSHFFRFWSLHMPMTRSLSLM
jgi:hypothetical protein